MLDTGQKRAALKGGMAYSTRLAPFGFVFLAGFAIGAIQRLRPARRRLRAPNHPLSDDGPVEALTRADWKTAATRAFGEFNHDHIPAVAAGATFFSLLALFPALGVFVSLYGLFGDVAGAQSQVAGLAGVLPAGGVSVLVQQMDRLAALPHRNLGLTFIASLLLSIWSANAGMKALIAGLNVAYEQEERRGFVALNLQSLAFTAGALVLAMAAAASVAITPVVLGLFHLASLGLLPLLRWPVLLVVTITMVSVFYRYGPSHRLARWRWITPGAVVAGLGWAIMSVAFSIYVDHFGSYDKTYGSLGAVIGFMTWIWFSLTVLLAGAELNCELERQA